MSGRRAAARGGRLTPSIACPYCQSMATCRSPIALRFRQMTRLGFVYCRAVVPGTECRACGAHWVEKEADDIMDEAVEQAYRALAAEEGDGL